jgi:peptidoglycan/xylan/chitin deacetylase (PgdA/CDA1 family)
MKKEKLIDIIAGIFSLFFIILISYLYFSNLFGNGGIYLNLNNYKCVTYEQKEHSSCHINIIEPTIVLRIDDVRVYSVPTPYLVDEIINRNLPVTLGVIPRDLEKDKEMQKYLLEIKENPNIEIAQHGTNHNEYDKNITEDILLEGNKKIQEILGIKPVTYIPPYNQITSEAREIVSKYFRIISGEEKVIKEGQNIAEIGYTAGTYRYNENEIIGIDEIIKKCEESLEKTNICVIMIHPQEYSNNINNAVELSEEKFEDFRELLDKLEKLDARFSTFNDLVTCYE